MRVGARSERYILKSRKITINVRAGVCELPCARVSPGRVLLQVNEKPYRPDVGVFLNPAHYLGYSLGLGYCT